jgi:hypothetical protein
MPPVILYPMQRFREPIVDYSELYCCPYVEEKSEKMWRSPRGMYDVQEFLHTLPEPFRRPNVLVIYHDLSQETIPIHLATMACPRVLIVGDTHHKGTALRRAITYAHIEPFDLIIGEFDRQHLHFFVEAGLRQTQWLPCFNITPPEHAPTPHRPYDVRFLGNINPDSAFYRSHVLQTLANAGVAVEVAQGDRLQVARGFSETKVNLNISLNGDLNQRVLEVLAAGGFLLTERLSPESGLTMLFENGRHLVTFDSIEHLKELIARFLRDRASAEAIAQAGNEEFIRRHRPMHKIQELFNMLDGHAPPDYSPLLDRRTALPPQTYPQVMARVAAYELLQELHRGNTEMRVLFWPSAERECCDAIDLIRLRPTLLAGRGSGELMRAAGLEHRAPLLDTESPEVVGGKWHVLVCRAEDLADPLLERVWRAGIARVLAICPAQQAAEFEAIHKAVERLELRLLNEDPPAYGRRE